MIFKTRSKVSSRTHSPPVAHELVITTADEKRFTIFRRVFHAPRGTRSYENRYVLPRVPTRV
jgi:hypothetical protein